MLSNKNSNKFVQAHRGHKLVVRGEPSGGKNKVIWCLDIAYPFTGKAEKLAFGFRSPEQAIQVGKEYIDGLDTAVEAC